MRPGQSDRTSSGVATIGLAFAQGAPARLRSVRRRRSHLMRRQQPAHAVSMVPAAHGLIGMVGVTGDAGQELLETLADAPDKLGVALAAPAEGLGDSDRPELAGRRPMGGPTRPRCCVQGGD
jgi:hypothetical protein